MSHLTRTQSKSYARAIPLTECVWNFQKMHCGILINMLAPDQCYTPASLVRPLRWCIADSSRAI